MNISIKPGQRSGQVKIPASKSQAHRLLICAALGRGETRIACDGLSADISATMACLNALGADIRQGEDGCLWVRPIETVPTGLCRLPCGESSSTPRRQQGELLHCGGKLRPGDYELPGNVSSQYISGLLLALPLLAEDSRLTVTGSVESAAYITMTEDALSLAGVKLERSGWTYRIPGAQRGCLPETLEVEGDFSNAAFFLCMGALSDTGLTITGLSPASHQGDRAVLDILRAFGASVKEERGGFAVRRGALHGITIDAKPIPDLIPVLSVVAALAQGETRIINAGRLRLKESDRLRSTTALLTALGAEVQELPEGLVIHGKPHLSGGSVDSCGDHRIAMAAATAACGCTGDIFLSGGQAVSKSYPRFWEDFGSLTGGSL